MPDFRSQLLKLRPEAPRPGRLRALATSATFLGRNLWQMASGSWYRFGLRLRQLRHAALSMRAWTRERGLHFPALDDEARHAEVQRVGAELMESIGRVVPVLPVSLVAGVMMREPERAWSELELKSAAHERMRELEAGGAHLYNPRQDQDYAFGVGLRMLTLRDLVTEDEGGLFRPRPDHLHVLAYYANAIEHLAAAGGKTS